MYLPDVTKTPGRFTLDGTQIFATIFLFMRIGKMGRGVMREREQKGRARGTW